MHSNSNVITIVHDPKEWEENQDDELAEEEQEYVDDDPRERPQFGEEEA